MGRKIPQDVPDTPPFFDLRGSFPHWDTVPETIDYRPHPRERDLPGNEELSQMKRLHFGEHGPCPMGQSPPLGRRDHGPGNTGKPAHVNSDAFSIEGPLQPGGLIS